MQIRKFDLDSLKHVYTEHLIFDFRKEEIKPFALLSALYEQGCYEGYGAYLDDGTLLAYALFVSDGEHSDVILDYYAVTRGGRGKGTGSAFLSELIEVFSSRLMLLEVENDAFAADDEERTVMQRRLGFYERLGVRRSTLCPNVFDVEFIIMYVWHDEKSDDELKKSLERIYHVMFPDEVYKKKVHFK